MRGTFLIARKEFLQHLYNKRFYVIGAMLMATMVLGAVLFPWLAYQGFQDDADPASEDYAQARAQFSPAATFATYLAIPLLGGIAFTQLLTIVLTSDSVCSEWQRKTVFLLLAKPVSRSGFVMGKFLGTFATVGSFTTVLAGVTFLVLHALFDFSLTAVSFGRFALGLLVLLLGIAAFTAFSVLISSMARSTVLSLLTVVSAWLLVFPLVGMTGFLLAATDDDFRRLGSLDRQGALADCGPDPWDDTYDPDTQTFQDPTPEEVSTWESCWQGWQDRVDDWYAERGLWDYDPEADLKACNELENETTVETCHQEAAKRLEAHDTKRSEILASKWDSPRVDWSRYLNPSAAMGVAAGVVRPGAEGGDLTEGMFFEGYSTIPSSQWGSVLALLLHTILSLAASTGLVKRRDFH